MANIVESLKHIQSMKKEPLLRQETKIVGSASEMMTQTASDLKLNRIHNATYFSVMPSPKANQIPSGPLSLDKAHRSQFMPSPMARKQRKTLNEAINIDHRFSIINSPMARSPINQPNSPISSIQMSQSAFENYVSKTQLMP